MLRLALAVPLTLAVLVSAASAADRPNILLVLVDDLGWQDTSVPFHSESTPLNERYRTPNLEALAARGVRFTNAYASAPVCTPTRTSIMTGRSPGRSHITYWTLHKDRDTSKHRDDIAAPPWNLNGLQQGDVTLPGLLSDAGYRTIHVGKAHFGAHDTTGADPVNLGFDVNIAGHASGGPASYYGEHHFTVAGREGADPEDPESKRTVWDIPGLDQYHGMEIYLTEALAIEAGRAIRDAVADDEPFFMNFAPYAVHAPIMANRRLLGHYPELDEKEAAYATMIESVDNALGSLVHTLEELGELENTVIIYTSDNGGLSAHARGAAPDGQTRHVHNAPLRSGKGSSYEGGTRVPAVVAWPGVTSPDSICHEPIISHDLFPTILAMADVTASETHARTVDGVSLIPLLQGEASFGNPRVLCWNQPHQWGASGPGIWPFTSIRRGDDKLIYFHAKRRFELYDLARDIGENNDLSSARPERVRALAGLLDDWIRETGAQLSIDRRTNKPVEMPGEAAFGLGELPVTMKPVPSSTSRAAAAGWGSGTWIDQHQAINRRMRATRVDALMLGDSITQSFGGDGRTVGSPGRAAWDRLAGHYVLANGGISGDRTQHILWRIDHGALGRVPPRTVILMIGTNNLPHDEPDEIARGIEAIVDRISRQAPETHVVLVSVPPRGESPDHEHRQVSRAVNAEISALGDRDQVTYVDTTAALCLEDGRANPVLMRRDFVHLSPEGYEVLVDQIKPVLWSVLE